MTPSLALSFKSFISVELGRALLLFIFCLPLVACSQEQPATQDVSAEREAVKEFTLPLDDTPIERGEIPLLNSFAPILKKTTPSVVAVYTARVVRVVRQSGPLSRQEELLRRFFGLPAPRNPDSEAEVEERRVPQGVGSGVIVSSDGYILTNNHVVSDERGNDADEVLVRLSTGEEYPAEIIGRDPNTDIAVLKVEAEDLPTAPIASSENLEVGDIVFAIGNPLGVGLTVTQGIISATGRAIGIYGDEGYEDFIQTDASINMGNSGGALVDTEGRLIGINSAILSRSGGNIGIGFAIPTNLATGIARQLVMFGEVRRGYLGVSTSDLSAEMAEAFDLETTEGALVNAVEEESPASLSGIERGDVIVSIDGRPVEDSYSLRLLVGQLLPESTVKIDFYRDGELKSTEVVLADRDAALGTGAELFTGVSVSPLTESSRDEFEIPDNVDGLLITAIEASSGYSRYLRPGMVFLEINDRPVTSLAEGREALRRGVNKLYVYDRGQAGYLALRLR